MTALAHDPEMMARALNMLELLAVAGTAGWSAERLLDPGIHIRGFSILIGLASLYFGPALVEMAGWPTGPEVAGRPLLAAFVGTLAVTALAKVFSVGLVSSRR